MPIPHIVAIPTTNRWIRMGGTQVGYDFVVVRDAGLITPEVK